MEASVWKRDSTGESYVASYDGAGYQSKNTFLTAQVLATWEAYVKVAEAEEGNISSTHPHDK